MLWQVEGSQLALLGSVHLLDEPDPPLSDAAWDAFNMASRVLFEADVTQQPDVSFARFPVGKSLRDVTPSGLFEAVQERCRECSLNIDFVASHEPWFAAMTLTLTMAARAGLNFNDGVDRRLWAHAREQGKAIEYLEEAATALRACSVAPLGEQLTMLRLTALDPELARPRRLIGAWKQRRADVVQAYVQEHLALMPIGFKSVIGDRNRAWLPRLRAVAEGRDQTLAVVGVLHTVGPDGIPALLRAAGYKVTAVDVSGE